MKFTAFFDSKTNIILSLVLITFLLFSSFVFFNKIELLEWVENDLFSNRILEIEKPINLSIANNRHSVHKEVGKTRIRSAAKWDLYAYTLEKHPNLNIYIRQNNNIFASWKKVNSKNKVSNGTVGLYDMGWDVRIQPKNKTKETEQNNLNIKFKLEKPKK
jgi:hypothetical protein